MKYDSMPMIEDLGMGFSVDDIKQLAILAGAGAGAMLAGDLTGLYPDTLPMPKYARPLLRVAMGAAAYYGLRRWNPGVADVAASVLVGSAIYKLVKPHLAGLPVVGPALADIVVEDRLLGALSPEERAYLSEVRQEPVNLLPPGLAEVVEEQLGEGDDEDDDDEIDGVLGDDDEDDDEGEDVAFMSGPPALHGIDGFDASWIGG